VDRFDKREYLEINARNDKRSANEELTNRKLMHNSCAAFAMFDEGKLLITDHPEINYIYYQNNLLK